MAQGLCRCILSDGHCVYVEYSDGRLQGLLFSSARHCASHPIVGNRSGLRPQKNADWEYYPHVVGCSTVEALLVLILVKVSTFYLVQVQGLQF